ncbi:hypothetical protein SAVIM338S_04623 [Streptomyces avidinii]
MAEEMSVELIISPSQESVRDDLAEAPGWSSYAAELRNILRLVIEASNAEALEIGELLVSRPLPDIHSQLHNGSEISPAEAVELVVAMVSGEGPYCRLSREPQLRIGSGWDGAVHAYVTSEVADHLMGSHGHDLSLQRRAGGPDPSDAKLVDVIANDEFWTSVRAVTGDLVLLCERWAYGSHGCRWFRVTAENATEVAKAVRPRSLLSVVPDPDLEPGSDLLDADFTAFKAPLLPGELPHRTYPGVGSLEEVSDEGYTLTMRDSALLEWCAVVPDADGVARGEWEDYRGA